MPLRRLAIAICILLIPAAILRGHHMGALAAALLAVWLVLVGRRDQRWKGHEGAAETGTGEVGASPGNLAAGGESRPPLQGTVEIEGRTWEVTEERRGGPWSQLLILKARDGGHGVMHVRPEPGAEARTLEEVEIQSANPTLRYFTDEGEPWQVRRVQATGEGGREIPMLKFISRDGRVRECRAPSPSGLGLLSDDDLRELLRAAREV